jgi:hypothetical protein
MARIVAEKSESSFSQVIHSAGVRRFGEAQLDLEDESAVDVEVEGDDSWWAAAI